jgi:hypothetical protein
MTHILDELTLQRCVDGELSEVEQQELLRQLERNPAGWREVALGFIEHQLWTTAGHDWIHDPVPPQVAPPVPESPPRRVWGAWLRNTALAASTLLAIGLGYVGGSRSFWSRPSGSPSAGVEIATGPSIPSHSNGLISTQGAEPVSHNNHQPPRPMMQVQLTSDGSGSEPISLPVYDATDLPEFGDWMTPRLSVEERRHLEDQGFQLREEPRFYTVPMDKNRQLVVPINTVHVRQRLQ